MIRKIEFEIDENVIIMQAFVRIVKDCYKGRGVYRDPKAVRKIRKALLEPESFCKLNIDANTVYKNYEKLKMFVDIEDFDPRHDVDVDQFTQDILNVANGIIDSPDDFGNEPFVNAGKFLEMINDKLYGYYKTGHFGEGHNDDYFSNVFDEQMKIFKPCDDTNTNSNPVDVDQIDQLAEKVKDKILGDITKEIPKAFEKTMFTTIKNVK